METPKFQTSLNIHETWISMIPSRMNLHEISADQNSHSSPATPHDM